MAPEIPCQARNKDGSRCKAPPRLVDPITGFCISHDPERRQAVKDAAQKGGKVMARRLRAPLLDDDDLPPLDSPHAAASWLEIIGRSVATGRLSNRDGDAVTRAVREWLKAHDAGEVSDQVNTLRSQLQEVRTQLRTSTTMGVVR